MTEERRYLNWLYHVPGFGRKKMSVILSHGKSAKEICEMPKTLMESFLREKCGCTEKQANSAALYMEELRKEKSPERLEEEVEKKGILFLMPGDPEYPGMLERIPDAPFALYLKGNRKRALEFSKQCIAVIGARECSVYGKYAADCIGKMCAQCKIPVASGMAYGVDGIAQLAAVENGAAVAAVLGCGVDICYPNSNRKLYDLLSEEGCIYSEYIPGTEPKPAFFPPRNRIISGMSDALVVVEAKEKSGTLITVDMALEQGREVYVIPGRINDPMSKGCNQLIRQGATIVCDIEEMLAEITGVGLHNLKCKREEKGKNPYIPGDVKYRIYEALDMQPKSVQQIFDAPVWEGEKNKPTIGELQTELFYMRMQGNVYESGGRYFV